MTDALFTEAEQIFVFRSRIGETDELNTLGGTSLSDVSVVMPVPYEDEEYLVVRAGALQWKPPLFDAIVRDIADDIEAHVTFVSPATRNIYAPYDGGMDVFPFAVSPSSLKARFGAWRSRRADQL